MWSASHFQFAGSGIAPIVCEWFYCFSGTEIVLSPLAMLFASWLWKYSSRGQQSTVSGKHWVSVLKALPRFLQCEPGFSSISSLSIRSSCSIQHLQNTARLASNSFPRCPSEVLFWNGPLWTGFGWTLSTIAEVPWGPCYPLPSKAKSRLLLFPQRWLWCLIFIVNLSWI